MNTRHSKDDWTLLIHCDIYSSNAHLTQGSVNEITPAEYEQSISAVAERVDISDWPPPEIDFGWDGLRSRSHKGCELIEYSIVRADGQREPVEIICVVETDTRLIRVVHVAPERWFALDHVCTERVYDLSVERFIRWQFEI